MKRKIILALLISTLLALSVVFMAGCGEVRLDSPKNLDILTESTGFVFKWDAVDGADGYLLYFNDDLSNRFYLVENKLPMNDSEIANYLKSGIANSVNIRAVKLDRNNFPVNQSAKSVILFNYSKKLNAPQRVSSVDGIVSFKTVSEAKNYKAMVYATQDADEGKLYELDWSPDTTGASGTIKDIEEGTYYVSVIASAEGYDDSDPSTRVEYTYIKEENLVRWDVTFDYNYEGTTATVVSVVDDHTTTALDATREGYNFLGWCEDKYGLFEVDFNKYKITAPTTFYAKWEKEGGEVVIVDPDDPVVPDKPEEPEECKYHFDGDGDGLCDRCGEAVPEYEVKKEVVKTVTVDVSAIEWFGEADATAYIYAWYEDGTNNAWPGKAMTPAGNGKYKIDMDVAELAGVIVVRVAPDGTIWNQTNDITDFGDNYNIVVTSMKES